MPEEHAFSHLDEAGAARMVDVAGKAVTRRVAVAQARVHMRAETLAAVESGGAPKGDVLAAARIAGISAAKRTAELIPLCHTLALTRVAVEFAAESGSDGGASVLVKATTEAEAKTGVEMEALTAATVAALTVYDMCKALDRGMAITDVRVLSKSGGTHDFESGVDVP